MLRSPTHAVPSVWPHRWACLIACATLSLIWWGGFVTSTDAGMAFRDWLTSDGHFMLLYPWLSSSGDKFVEHGHRLLAALVGLLCIVMAAIVRAHRMGREVRWLSWALLIGVVGQGVLGGMRVVLDQRTLALVHGCTAPLFFALCTAMVVVTSKRWAETPAKADGDASTKLARAAVVCASLAYTQVVLGALLRHSPRLTGPAAATLFQLAVYFHLLLAAAILAYAVTSAFQAHRSGRCRGLTSALVALVVGQIMLGMATWVVKYGVPRGAESLVGDVNVLNVEASFTQAALVTSHVATGSLIVAVSTATAMFVLRSVGWCAPRLDSPTAAEALA